uniref:Reverse transcriptase domain-containing protein n=1 Tax=Meloidogyne enterolobii TaxID=390850 RepID=A0A6V7VXF1_MELEN|nr:unnamed protein product [Meloidogyne enterolobii]
MVFRKNHSVITQLLETFNDYTLAIENKKCVDVIFFDLAKAFDTVPHDRLLKKLYHLGITGALLNWIEDYLLNRTFTVLVESKNSNEYHITSGVPQGSILGPILFISYIFDIIDICKTDNVTPKLFADDLKAYTCFDFLNKNHYSPLQTFIQTFTKYCEINGLKIAVSKCSSFHIGTKNPFHQYTLQNINIPIIPPNEPIRDLGIYFTSNLKWDSHIKITTNKATRIYYTLIRSLKTNNTQFLITLFKIYVLPILEFGSPIINPYLNKDINSLENVQHKFLKIIYLRSMKHNNSPILPNYKELLELFKLESLSHRRLKSNLILFHNIISGKINLKHDNTYSILPTTTRGNPHNLFIPFCSSTIRKNSFFIDIPNIYRKLPTELQKSSIELFPKLLNNINLNNILSKSNSILLSPDLIQNF